MKKKRHPAAVTFEKSQFQLRMPLANAAADDVDQGHHVFHRVGHDVAQQQIIAEAVADLRRFARGRRRVKTDRHAQILQGRPKRIEVARVPG